MILTDFDSNEQKLFMDETQPHYQRIINIIKNSTETVLKKSERGSDSMVFYGHHTISDDRKINFQADVLREMYVPVHMNNIIGASFRDNGVDLLLKNGFSLLVTAEQKFQPVDCNFERLIINNNQLLSERIIGNKKAYVINFNMCDMDYLDIERLRWNYILRVSQYKLPMMSPITYAYYFDDRWRVGIFDLKNNCFLYRSKEVYFINLDKT